MRARPLSPLPIRQDALAGSAVPRRAFPAWIDADAGLSYVAIVTPRVRDDLVLRLVTPAKPGRRRSVSDARRAH